MAAAEGVYVFDYCAFIAFLQDEPGADDVTRLMKERRCLIHAIDHHEFDPVAAADLCPIHFIR